MKIFITAAVGRPQLLKPASRLIRQVEQLQVFDKSVVVTQDDLQNICPHLFRWYTEEQLLHSHGYGFYVWKSAIAKAAFNGYWGEPSHILYLDAGCEVIPSNRAQRVIGELLTQSERQGVACFSAGGIEWQYSKPELFDYFPEGDALRNTPQVQGGTWAMSGELGLNVAAQWDDLASSSPFMTDGSSENLPQGFIAPRHDQSLFSLVVKNRGISPVGYQMPYPRDNLISQLRGLSYPIWASRNLSEASIIKKPIKLLTQFLS